MRRILHQTQEIWNSFAWQQTNRETNFRKKTCKLLASAFNRELKEYHSVIVRDRENKRRRGSRPVGKEYFNCRSTREFRAHIRRSTDLSRTAEGLLAFSETKNKRVSRG